MADCQEERKCEPSLERVLSIVLSTFFKSQRYNQVWTGQLQNYNTVM